LISDTELRLSFWRDGSTKAERLAAAALRLSGYEEIDPQSPLGGPDGKKDILCQKGGLVWVGAVYFPSGPARFTAVKKKFKSDLDGMPVAPTGFVFVTNQSLSPTQRSTLSNMVKVKGKEVDILHLQQLQNLFDSAPGYGVRIQYLGIEMNIEEQLSWAVDSDSQTAKALAAHTRELLALRSSVDRMRDGQSHIIKTLGQATAATVSTPDLISVSSFKKSDAFPAISANLSPELVLLFHRLTCFDLPSRAVGQFRTRDVWLGNLEGRIATHVQPPSPEQVADLLIALCEDWRKVYTGLRNQALKLDAVAKFHANFLLIHPFVDGNGRVARALLMQQCLDLFGKADMSLMGKGADYYSALQAADAKNYRPLVALLKPVVSN
jgi:fido (protein-threonine AMPylation protein)